MKFWPGLKQCGAASRGIPDLRLTANPGRQQNIMANTAASSAKCGVA
jgi:hypothetical protein